MITVNPSKRTIRETKAPYEYVDGSEVKVAEIRVRYYSYTTRELKEEFEERKALIARDKDAVFWHSDKLARRLASLPDLVDENGKPFDISVDFLDSLDTKNVRAIVDSIDEDTNPKS